MLPWRDSSVTMWTNLRHRWVMRRRTGPRGTSMPGRHGPTALRLLELWSALDWEYRACLARDISAGSAQSWFGHLTHAATKGQPAVQAWSPSPRGDSRQ